MLKAVVKPIQKSPTFIKTPTKKNVNLPNKHKKTIRLLQATW